MFYYCTSSFLFETDILTTVRLIRSTTYRISRDPNNRQLNIFVPEGKCSNLRSFGGFTVIDDEADIEFGTLPLRDDNFIIKGVRFYFHDGVTRFSQLFTRQFETGVWTMENMTFSLFNIESHPQTVEEYVDFYNSSGQCYCRAVEPSKWDAVNYYDVNVLSNRGRESNSKDVTDFDPIFITAEDIIAAYLDKMQEWFPDIVVTTEMSDLTDRSQDTAGHLFIKAGLPTTGTQYSRRLIADPELGKYLLVEIGIESEYVTADLKKFINFRNDFLMEKKAFEDVKFTVIDPEGVPWNCIANYDYKVPEELDIKPQEKEMEGSFRYSFKYKGRLSGYIVYSYVKCPIIKRFITNLRTDSGVKIATKVTPEHLEETQ